MMSPFGRKNESPGCNSIQPGDFSFYGGKAPLTFFDVNGPDALRLGAGRREQ